LFGGIALVLLGIWLPISTLAVTILAGLWHIETKKSLLRRQAVLYLGAPRTRMAEHFGDEVLPLTGAPFSVERNPF
jgi:fibrillarin-like rRNA methylase